MQCKLLALSLATLGHMSALPQLSDPLSELGLGSALPQSSNPVAALDSVLVSPQSSDAVGVGNDPISSPYLSTGTAPGQCTRDYRLAGAKQIIFSYNLVGPGRSAAAFQRLPLRGDCHTFINANGAPAAPVAIDRTTTYDFAVATRELFSRVTGEYTDYVNGTTVIHTDVTLGLLHSVPIPVTFSADVHLTYDLSNCLMEKIQAFATIPTVVAGIRIQPPILDMLMGASSLYTGDDVP